MPAEPVIHVVDDDVAVRQSLAFLLASDGLAVRLYDSATAFLDQSGGRLSGLVVTDVRMPGIDGIALLKELRQRRITVPVIVMTGHADVPLAVAAMKEGAVDFVEKPFDDELLLSAIRAALRERAVQSADQRQRDEAQTRLAALSEREAQVMAGLVAGKANKQIAGELGISHRTVEIHRAKLMLKLQARSLSDLVRLGVMAGVGQDKRAAP
jgi:two-component system, LuxR family, response regulator FixJ